MNNSPEHRAWLLSQLRAALARLAAPALEQLACLRDLGVSPPIDELALELDDVTEAALTAECLLSPEQQQLVSKVIEALSCLSESHRTNFWTEAALTDSAEWQQLRERAREALLGLQPAT